MSKSFETKIEVDKDVPLVRIIREFAAAPAEVFRAHSEAELYAKWIGPNDNETRIEHFDCRTGGSYRWASLRAGEQGFGFHVGAG